MVSYVFDGGAALNEGDVLILIVVEDGLVLEAWMQGIAKHFNDNAKDYKFTKLSYLCKYESRLYTRVLLGIVKK